MPISAPLQSSFEGGEISPLLYGRVDSPRYKNSLALCKNWLPMIQGSLARRPGTNFVGLAKATGIGPKLIPFSFSTTQSYILEFGYDPGISSGYIRFWANYGQVLSSGSTPLEILHPYSAVELNQIKYTQSADVLYLVHQNHPPMKLERFSATSWQLIQAVFSDGPYLDIIPQDGLTVYSLTVGATSGSTQLSIGWNIAVTGAANNGSGLVRLTLADTTPFESGQTYGVGAVAGTTEANGTWVVSVVDSTHIDLEGSAFVNAYISGGVIGLAPFASTDVGRLVRIGDTSGSWGWAIITGFSATSTVDIHIQGTLASTTAIAFALGAWSETTGYPSNACFNQDRLCLSGSTANPERIDASVTSDYQNFAPSQASDGTVQDNNAFSFSLNANDVNQLEWMVSDARGLLAGSVSSEWDMTASTTQIAITPSNVNVSRQSKWGSAPNVNAFLVGICTLFLQRGGRKLRELNYQWAINGYMATDLSELAEHITGNGIVDMAYQSIPISVVWMVRSDGALVGCTYARDMQSLQTGWHQHVLGGNGDDSGSPPKINSIAVIPDPTGVKDDLWLSVARSVNGTGNTYCIEYMNKIFEDIDDYRFATFMDSVQTLDNPNFITVMTNASPCQITAPSHGFTTGNSVRLDSIVGMMTGEVNPPVYPPPTNPLNGKVFTVTVIDTDNFTIAFDTTSLTSYQIGGLCRKLDTVISGLTAKEGETVSILADGAVQPNQVVSNTGTITLQQPAATVLVGYCYNSQAQLLRLEAGARNGTSLGKRRRTHKLGIMVHRSGPGLLVGPNFTSPDPILFRTENQDLNGFSVGLYSGILSESLDFDYDFDNQICLTANNPLPCLISAIMPMLETQDAL